MSNKKNVRLLTTAIVTALHPNQPVLDGTVYNPEDFGSSAVQEANALVLLKLAERTSDKVTFAGKTLDSDKPNTSGFVNNDDTALKVILEGTVAQVEEAIASKVYTLDQVKRLGELNTLSEKPRAGVADAVLAFVEANEETEEE